MHNSNHATIKTHNDNSDGVSRFRQILPQVIASTVKNFLLLDLGLSIAYPTIVIPALTGLNDQVNPNETIHMNAAQASWLGSIAYLFKLIGSILSGWICEPIGRKKAMFFVNFPHLIAWLMLYFSASLTEVFVAHALFGFGVGFVVLIVKCLMETPILTYVGEICEKSVRGTLLALSGIATTLGLFIVFTLGNLIEWRSVALFCFLIPVGTMIAVRFIPETPIWLLSKGRDAEALKSLQWLRGWVSEKAVQSEFEAIKRYNQKSNSCLQCEKAKVKCTHPPPNLNEKFKELLRKRTLKPFIILMCCQFMGHFSGIHHLMPYIVPILNTYESPISPGWATSILGLTGVFATISCVVIVKFVGKRRIHLFSLTMVSAVNLALGFYGLYRLPSGTKSYEHKHFDSEPNSEKDAVPLVLFIILRFFSTGITLIPFVLMSELFPFKSRCFATGISAAIGYIIGFGSTKSFYNIETWLSLPTALIIYGTIGVIGLIVAYNILPETEKRTLEEIELHFSDNNRKLTDRKIYRLKKSKAASAGPDIIVDNTANNGHSNKAFVPEKY